MIKFVKPLLNLDNFMSGFYTTIFHSVSIISAAVMMFTLASFSVEVNAQARVVEAGGAQLPGSNNNDVIMNLYLQLESLQVEVQTLRGIIEEQSYSISRMQTEQRSRYLDLDRRISGGVGTGNLPLANDPVGTRNTVDTTVNTTIDPAIPAQPTPVITNSSTVSAGNTISNTNSTTPTGLVNRPVSEQEIYRSALNLLLEDSKYDESIVMFQQYIDSYPSGRLLTNAYYWQGEALLLTQNYSRARDVFVIILEDYPQDPKAPGAMLKLGVSYSQLGNTEQARIVWQRIAQQYPNSLTEIRAADDYLVRIGN